MTTRTTTTSDQITATTTATKIRSAVCLIFTFGIFLFFGSYLKAAPKCPTVRASVRATATVVHPLGISTQNRGMNTERYVCQNKLWMVRHPRPDGIQMTVSLNGTLIRSVGMEEIVSENNHDNYTLINPYDQLIQSGDNIGLTEGTIVVTLISTTQ